ncbi:hypothetical protein BV898_16382 [Hypsibius exemplaris]|uniref:Uncharacterized protein n=1 Tax=Hypsibius exemplaris TaxID=2072580 RepID=A0A9X6RLJ4_HYPEX|nr:hypothetical protein BV898_16382 [Hypsibius exemplaris]
MYLQATFWVCCLGRIYFYPFPGCTYGSITQQTVIVAAQPSVNGARQYQCKGIIYSYRYPECVYPPDEVQPLSVATSTCLPISEPVVYRCKGIIYSYPFPECAYGPPPALGAATKYLCCLDQLPAQQRTYRSSVLIPTTLPSDRPGLGRRRVLAMPDKTNTPLLVMRVFVPAVDGDVNGPFLRDAAAGEIVDRSKSPGRFAE